MLKKKEIVERIKLENCKSLAKAKRYLYNIYGHKFHSDGERCIFAGYVAGVCESIRRSQKSR